MPSIKAVLVSLALSALAVAPIAQASPVQAGEALTRRSSPSFYSNEASVEKRSGSRKELAARVKRAKLAAARKAKRAERMTFAQQMALRKAAAAPARGGAVPARGGAVPARGGAVRGGAGSSSAGSDGAYSPSSPFLNTPQALAAATIRCGIDIVCERRTSPPTNANAVCLSGRCTFRCEQGYAPGGPQGTECVQGSNSCGGNTCATVENGYSTCAGTTCSYGCSTGYSLYNSGNSVVCLNLQSDPDNCGAQGNVCPTSYNGVGSRTCSFGQCRLACPFGSYVRRTQSGGELYCYGA